MSLARCHAAPALALVLALAGCLHDDYTCHTDSDCNLGSGGRCELDHRCTQYDSTCALGRRYVHAGPQTGACFQDAVAPANPCAPGQPPAPTDTTDPCASAVCAKLPSCCTTGWSEACVQQAQVSCALTCDTRIAITAERNLEPSALAPYALYDLRFGAGAPSYQRIDTLPGSQARAGFLAWLAPAPGATEPRLAGLDAGRQNLVIDDGSTTETVPLPTDRSYGGVDSVDFDRDARDEAVLACHGVPDGAPLRVLDLATQAQRGMVAAGQMPLVEWGDWDGDGFPDALAAAGNSQTYYLVHGVDSGDASHQRVVEEAWAAGTGMNLGPPLTSFSWADVDRDGALDMIAWGAELRVHFAHDTRPPNQPRVRVDCTPLALNPPNGCATTSTNVDIVGTARAGDGAPLVFSITDGSRNLYELAFSGQTPTLPTTPLWSEICAGEPCQPIRAIVARDLDGDHQLDLIAIDAQLGIYIRYATGTIQTIAPPSTTSFALVRVSVSGAPR